MADRERARDERSPEEIRAEIERTRTHLDDTVDAIGDKLSPGKFVDELWVRVQSEGAAAVAHTLREHPIPFTLVGAGLGWLVYERASGRPHRPDRRVRRGSHRGGDGYDRQYDGDLYEGVEYEDDSDGGMRSRAADALRHGKESLQERKARLGRSAADALHGAGEKASSAAEAVSEKLSEAKESVSETADGATRRVRHRAERAQEGFWDMLERNPVAVGAIALGAGLAAGLSVPRTRWEDERMGRAARSFKQETKHVVEETAGKVMGVAQETYDAVREEAGRKRDEVMESDALHRVVDEVKESVQEVKAAAADTARERSREEGLTPEGMKEMASRPAEAARRAAKK
jgi:hypothetical protein